MAKNSDGDKKKKKKKVRKRKAGSPFSNTLLLTAGMLFAVVFLQTTVFLAVGMLPTIVAFLVDRNRQGTLALTIGAMNVAGCVPFLVEIWTLGHNFNDAMETLANPRTIIVMYSAAAIGYLINWSTGGVVQTIMIKQAESRLGDIDKRKKELVRRWGKEVTGEYKLDPFGFAIDAGPDEDEVGGQDE